MAVMQQVLLGTGSATFISGIPVAPLSLVARASSQVGSFELATASINLTLPTNGLLTLNYEADGLPRNETQLISPAAPVSEQYPLWVGEISQPFSVRVRITSGGNFNGIFGIPSAPTGIWIPITSDLTWGMSSGGSFGLIETIALTAVLEIAYTPNLTEIVSQVNLDFAVGTSSPSINIFPF